MKELETIITTLQASVQAAWRGHHLRRDGAGTQPAPGPGIRVGPDQETRVRGLLWCPGNNILKMGF